MRSFGLRVVQLLEGLGSPLAQSCHFTFEKTEVYNAGCPNGPVPFHTVRVVSKGQSFPRF